MIKTLKFKIAAVYIFLVFNVAIVGATSILNMYSLNRSIDGLMGNNYKSIHAIGQMLEVLNEQNNAANNYLHVNLSNGIDHFHQNTALFYKWYNIESNNVTETGEEILVDQINHNYSLYLKLFSQLQEVNGTQGVAAASLYFEENMLPVFSELKENLSQLTELNERAMFRSKEALTEDVDRSMYAVILLSTAAVIMGFIISRYSTNRTLKPVYSLRETIKAVKEGNLAQQAPIMTQDEIGELTKEFNSMIKRLYKLEESNLGKLLAEKTKSDAIVKSISDPLIVLDNNYRIILLNNASEKLFHIKEETAVNKYFLEVIHNGDLYDFIYNASKSGTDEPEQKIFHFDIAEKDYYFNIIATVVKNAEASINGMIVLLQNVTSLKQLEKIKSNFISVISHEFKTPLTSIMIGTSLILDTKIGKLNEKQHGIIETIKEDGERLNALVNNLLELSKLESDQSVFNITTCTATELVNNTLKHFSEQAHIKGVILSFEAEKTLPLIKADPEKIHWVLNNLVSNALKYTESGDKILIKTFVAENRMCISVTDTGSGIPEEYHEKVFERFVQVKGENPEIKGTGLGLAIAREIVEAHGGEIWCHSKPGSGSTFIFTLPLAEEE
jgi:signal transduction histidine kinase